MDGEGGGSTVVGDWDTIESTEKRFTHHRFNAEDGFFLFSCEFEKKNIGLTCVETVSRPNR